MATHKSPLADVAPVPGVKKPDPVLVIQNVRRAFGGLQAVDLDYLEIERHTITSLIGPNGAGKTTLFNLLTGFDSVDEGRWHIDGGALVGISAYQVARRGVVRTFQLTRSLARLTVLENVLLAAKDQRGESMVGGLFTSWRQAERTNTEKAMTLLEQFGLSNMRNEFAGSLSGGQRKLLEMARALMVDPEVIMLDEPMAGVNPALTQSLLEHIKALRDAKKTVIFIEHDMDVVQEISDWVVVLAQGALIAEGPPAHIAANPEVIDAYLGGHHGEVP